MEMNSGRFNRSHVYDLLRLAIGLSVAVCIGCASSTPVSSTKKTRDDNSEKSQSLSKPQENKVGQGTIEFDITDVVGRPLHAKVKLVAESGATPIVFELDEGIGTTTVASGNYTSYVYTYENGIPYLIDFRKLSVANNQTTYLPVSLLEGSAGARPLSDFDADYDLAIDTVELKAGTDPRDAASIPGLSAYTWPSPVLKDQAGWYSGELQVHSNYGRGSQSVSQLVRIAERMGLDFLAITDRNTLDAPLDPDFKSRSVVLIPAMEWGDESRGVALVYAPRTFPQETDSVPEAQAISIRVQAQGGIFAIAYPCFPTSPWQWGLRYVNAIQGWCRDWRGVPPMSLQQITDESILERRNGKLIHSLANAAATPGRSANGQSTLFWDLELKRGLKAGIIAGSNSSSPVVPMASPVTYVYALEKSLRGILDGIRRGRTIVAKDLNAPRLYFTADVLNNGKVEIMLGGSVPLRQPTRFIVDVEGGKGTRLEVLMNGLPIRSMRIKSDQLTYSFVMTPDTYSVLRVRILGESTGPGFDILEMLTMTSAIYAQEIVVLDEDGNELTWVEIENDYADPEALREQLPPEPSRFEIKPRTP